MNFFPKVQNKIAFHRVIVPEEDHHTFSISHPKHLLLIDTPLATERDLHHGSHSNASSKHPQNTVHEVCNDHSLSGSHHDQSEIIDPDEPILKRPHEASTIQLFFDLFFVANLTTFTTNHEIDDWDSKYTCRGPTQTCNRLTISQHSSPTLAILASYGLPGSRTRYLTFDLATTRPLREHARLYNLVS